MTRTTSGGYRGFRFFKFGLNLVALTGIEAVSTSKFQPDHASFPLFSNNQSASRKANGRRKYRLVATRGLHVPEGEIVQ